VLKTISKYDVWLATKTHGCGIFFDLDSYTNFGKIPEPKAIQNDHMRFKKKAASSFFVFIAIKKKGYNTKNDIANTKKNHVFQMGANRRFTKFMCQR
jgi:hypothetical protein